jgi:hypothetical protein
MKVQPESKTKTRIAIALVVVAVLSLSWSLFSSRAGRSESTAMAGPAPKVKADSSIESLDPRLRLDLLANSEAVKYEGTGKNIFRDTPDVINIPKVKVPPLTRQQQAAARAAQNAPPAPPPINLKFFGTSNGKGERPGAFLSDGDDVWVAHEGDVVNRHYKIVRISPTSVDVEDLLNNNRKSIPLTQG